jgi:uncharacterized RDD family membrane protein YckC
VTQRGYVGPFARALAVAIDEPIRWALLLLAVFVLSRLQALSLTSLAAAGVMIYWAYAVVFEVFGGGQTPGKRALRIAVVADDGTRVRLGQSLLRNVMLLLDVLPSFYLLGAVSIVATPQFCRLGDMLGATRVVYCDGTPRAERWQAADRGCALLRRWPVAAYGSWLAVALPVGLLLWGVLRDSPGLASVLLWWLKPLYERLPLWALQRRAAEQQPGLTGADWRALGAGLAAALTWRRLATTRSFDAAAAVLERAGAARRATLHRRGGGHALWLTVIGAHVEGFVVLAAVLWWFAAAPVELNELTAVLLSGRLDWAVNAVYFVAIGLVGPCYAAAGLTLYQRCAAQPSAEQAP